MTRHILSKSTFMYGSQCLKRLYLHKFNPELRNPMDAMQQAIFDSGTGVGELAQKLFPRGVDASPPNPFSYHLSVAKTQQYIGRQYPVIYEAAFNYEGVLCAMDILVKKQDRWHAFEVKGTNDVKEPHIQDAGLQYYVMKNSGLDIADISIVHLNREYVRQGALNVQQLFTTQSVLQDALALQDAIAVKVDELKDLLRNKQEPQLDIGPHCSLPYGCDFTNHCWSHIPEEHSVFSLARDSGWKLYEAGYRHLDDIPDDFPMSASAKFQLEYHRSGEIHLDRSAIKSFLSEFVYPLYFLDFETCWPAVPEFDQNRPYQQIPFQYSLHIQDNPGAALQHHAFLGDGHTDPRPALIENLLRQIGTVGNVVVYNQGFEQSRLRELARDFSQYADDLLSINERMVDLMQPFQKRWYYHPAFRGSYSIKAVLPVLVPDLSYTDLEIQEGGTASLVYAQLKHQDEPTRQLQRKQLLDYCRLDTLAMARVLENMIKL